MMPGYIVSCPHEGCDWRGGLFAKGFAQGDGEALDVDVAIDWCRKGFAQGDGEAFQTALTGQTIVFECPSCKREWRARITEEGAVNLPLREPAPVTAPAAPPPAVPAPAPLPPAQPRRSLTARRLLAILLLAGALGSASLGAWRAGWLEFLPPAARGDTAEGTPEDGPPGESPADEIDPGHLALNLKERASHPDELVALFEVPQKEPISARAASADGRWLAI